MSKKSTVDHPVEANRKRPPPSEILAVAFLGIPVVGLLLGGVYAMPAMKVSKEREPWLSLLLSVGLAGTVFGMGLILQAPMAYLACVWGLTIVLLLTARWVYGSLGHSLERFGVVHVAAIVLTGMASVVARVGGERL